MKLTKAQRVVLEALANGHKMIFSRDGDEAWLSPKHATGFLNDEQTICLRTLGYIHNIPDLDEFGGMVDWHGEITPAGRTALEGRNDR